jgi:hypothetical protein
VGYKWIAHKRIKIILFFEKLSLYLYNINNKMEVVKVLSPVEDRKIRENIEGSPIWKGKRYHESELAIAEKENEILYEYSFKFDGLRCIQFTGSKKLAK